MADQSNESKRLRVTLIYEYDVYPGDYDAGDAANAMTMASLDLAHSPEVLLESESRIVSAEIVTSEDR